ncbi:hypothetical protein EQP59_03610 [Ornithobacterium rhinotracheale]|uniref:Uncharacterized protein n=1 Tax=Ornithobacterium rhinotracheale TaxID=28251 RepID=A0A3R5URG8_ORNRH|nr:hypothetical protein [Ornithobacterium rhinotracheale]QAR30504.1 hypothetical protein EQP59_03610 [Ornithobacterium rhinotracheale]
MINIIENPTKAISAHLREPKMEAIFAYYKALFRVNFRCLDFELSPVNFSEYAKFLYQMKRQKMDTQISVKITESELLDEFLAADFWDYWLIELNPATFKAQKSIFNQLFSIDKSLINRVVLQIPLDFFVKEIERLFSEISKLKITKIRITETEQEVDFFTFEKMLQLIEIHNFEYSFQLNSHHKNWAEKWGQLYAHGARNFVTCLHGLQGGIPTERIISFALAHQEEMRLNSLAFEYAYNVALQLFQR